MVLLTLVSLLPGPVCVCGIQANGSKGGGAMSATEAEAMRAYVVKLQKKLKDTQQALRYGYETERCIWQITSAIAVIVTIIQFLVSCLQYISVFFFRNEM